ncbi:MAG: hypothetical protein AVDCRST_MAG37-405 [uncultured Rubrobacteraceae bacterium]|uniref:Uncharacterized protein n=1 Tax=uncultured Rubrobacteraceae bacterium TaxID=349277 RepID=A0A6J4PX02_9ACTN|nr:MAG: hypothetical protein AVDCRST_MAG37-405 [uncultured Rubrobacteraceae bacterium]
MKLSAEARCLRAVVLTSLYREPEPLYRGLLGEPAESTSRGKVVERDPTLTGLRSAC